jgi:DNA-binding beta-propeller fold protein YncE
MKLFTPWLALAGLLLLTALQLAQAQNVGIGTTTPTQTLDVNGNLRVRAAAGSSDGRLLSVAADGTLQVQNAPFGATATTTAQAPVSLGSSVATGSKPFGVAVNSAGTRAYVTNNDDSTLQIFDLTGSVPVSLGTVPTGKYPTGVAVNPAGTRAYVLSDGNTSLQTFDLTGAAPVSLGTPVATGTNPTGVAVNPAGTRAYVVNINGSKLQTFDLTGGAPMSVGTPVSTYILSTGVAVNPAGTRAYVTGNNNIQTFDLTGNDPVRLGPLVTTGKGPYGVAVNPAGTRAYVTNSSDKTLQTFDLTGSAPVSLGTPVPTGSGPRGVAVNPAGTRAYVINSSENTLQTFVIAGSRLVAVGADGTLGSVDPATLPGDNLGNHTATQNLNLASYQLVGNGGTQGVSVDMFGKVGIGTTAPSQRLEVAGQVYSNYGGFRFPDNTVQTTAFTGGDNLGNHMATQQLVLASAGLRFADGTQQTTAFTGGDNLGNHTATQNLNLASYQLVGNGGTQGVSVSSGGNVGIGTTAPVAALHIDGAEGTSTTAVGVTLGGGSSSNPNIELRSVGRTPYIDFAETSGVDFTTRLISQGGTLNVAYGGAASQPTYLFKVNGGLQCTSLNQTSDARLKTQVRPLTGALASVLALRGVRYRWNALGVQRGGTAGAEQVGLLAQELEQVYPELVSTDAQGYKAVNYAQLTPVLLEALKEQQLQIRVLQDQVAGATQQANQATAAQQADHADLQTLKAQLARLLGEPSQASAR